jgi:signal transduction histidine kinase
MAIAHLRLRGKKFPLSRGVTLIGRDPESHVLIDDQRVSGRHALIAREGDQYLLIDFKSSNGVKVDGRPVTQIELLDGYVIEIGGEKMAFENAGAEGAGAPSGRAPAAGSAASGADPRREPDPVSDTLVPEGSRAPQPGAKTRSGEEIIEDSLDKDIDTLLKEKQSGEGAVLKLLILYKVSSIVNSMREPGELLESIIDLALQVMSADRGFIMLLADSGGLETRVRRVKEHDKEREKDILPVSRSIAEHCFSSGEAILTNDAVVDRRFIQSGSIQMYNIRSAMCVPLKYREEKKGVLYVDNRMSSNSFSPSDFLLLKAFADQVAIAIENSKLLAHLKASLAQIQSQQEMLIQSEKMSAMGHLAAGLAHEIRNPLTAISGYLQMYFMKFAAETPFFQQMKVMEKAVNHIQHVVEGLLGFARKGPRQLSPGQVNQVLEDTLTLARPALVAYPKVHIACELAPELPEIPMDQRQLAQVFLNFVINAAQAMPDGGRLTVSTRKVQKAGAPDGVASHIEVAFADSGAGIPREKQSQVFQPFFTSGKKGGTGLGLTISKSIIEAHRGLISFDSAEGRGTTFTVKLPVAAPAPAPEA